MVTTPVQILEDDNYGYEPGWYDFGWTAGGLELFGPFKTEDECRKEMVAAMQGAL